MMGLWTNQSKRVLHLYTDIMENRGVVQHFLACVASVPVPIKSISDFGKIAARAKRSPVLALSVLRDRVLCD